VGIFGWLAEAVLMSVREDGVSHCMFGKPEQV
jgi:hypothetical protein